MSATHQSVQFPNIAATTSAFTLKGGKYCVSCTATFGGGNVQFQKLMFDLVTWINMGSAFVTAGSENFDLPPGQYRFVVTTATAVFVDVTNVPSY